MTIATEPGFTSARNDRLVGRRHGVGDDADVGKTTGRLWQTRFVDRTKTARRNDDMGWRSRRECHCRAFSVCGRCSARPRLHVSHSPQGKTAGTMTAWPSSFRRRAGRRRRGRRSRAQASAAGSDWCARHHRNSQDRCGRRRTRRSRRRLRRRRARAESSPRPWAAPMAVISHRRATICWLIGVSQLHFDLPWRRALLGCRLSL